MQAIRGWCEFYAIMQIKLKMFALYLQLCS